MTTLQFADTPNLVVFLTKSAESEGIKQIVDFLNASSIKYDLIVNPTIYTSCIEQFWSTAGAKMVNGEVQLQALVDGKNIVVTEASVRRDLQLEDANGVDCLPNAIIFEQLTLMGYEKLLQKLTFYKAFFSPQWKFLIHTILQCLSSKTTAWNEFSSTMASAIICLANNQKFNFSKYIFESMMKNLGSDVKFLMYPRFMQVFMDNQLEGMINHNRIYIEPSHTKKVFANMKRQGKDFSGRVTPLFSTMMVQAQQEQGEAYEAVNEENVSIPMIYFSVVKINQPSSSQPQKKQKPRKSKKQNIEVSQPSDSTEPIVDEAPNDENVTTYSNNPLLSGEDRLKLNELMELCTNLSQRVLDLENTKTSQAAEITKLKERVKKLERKNKSRTLGLKRLRKVGRTVRIESSEDKDEEVTLIDETQGRNDDNLMFDTGVLDEQEVDVEKVVSTAEVTTASVTTTTVDELTLAETLIEIKEAKPKVVTNVATTTTTAVTRPKAKGVKDQILIDEEIAQRLQEELQVELEEEERPARQKEEYANIFEWDNVQAMMDADYELAARLQAQEQEELTIEERSKMFVELMDKRKKHFARLRSKEQRKKPPTKAQKRNTMSIYLKNMARYKHNQLKTKSIEDIQMLFDKAMTRKQKLDENVEVEVDDEAEIKKLMEIVPDDEVAIDVIPLATKPPIIIDWKIIKEGKMGYFQIIRAYGSSRRYSSMIKMLQNIDREDLETLWKLVKAKHGNTRPEEGG
ncbi:hypothetical protein Tco_0646013 [Tanacetum coccineum]